MTAQIINFKRAKSKKAHVEKKNLINEANVSNFEIFHHVVEEVLGEWQSAAERNRLSDYIYSKLPLLVRSKKQIDYVNDLSALSIIETKLGMTIGVFSPGATKNNPIGWLATFHTKEEVFGTPPDMVTESMARALNIVLFLIYNGVLKSLDRK